MTINNSHMKFIFKLLLAALAVFLAAGAGYAQTARRITVSGTGVFSASAPARTATGSGGRR